MHATANCPATVPGSHVRARHVQPGPNAAISGTQFGRPTPQQFFVLAANAASAEKVQVEGAACNVRTVHARRAQRPC
eukprot:15430444-Alexandrium_andersonii.AAC.1